MVISVVCNFRFSGIYELQFGDIAGQFTGSSVVNTRFW